MTSCIIEKLTSELRLDIPFIPHIGVANGVDPYRCKALADELNTQSFAVTGSIEKLDIVRYENHQIETIEQVILG